MTFNSRIRYSMALACALVLLPLVAQAQKPISESATISKTFVIDAIDHSSRLVTLRDTDGNTETIHCGPGVERFDALKVGDKVTFRYHESVVSQITKAAAGAKPMTYSAAVNRAPGAKPAATIAEQVKATVVVDTIDTKTPSIAVSTADKRKMSFKVENPKYLAGLKAGDAVEITYTRALAISVGAAGK
jgi:Cu/Ag efflux protein CusF